MYTYTAKVKRVVDGDTADILVDCGFGISHKIRVRLLGINAPETRGQGKKKGLASKAFLINLIEGEQIMIRTQKDKKGSFGRYLATLYLIADNGMININDLLVEKGHAVYKNY